MVFCAWAISPARKPNLISPSEVRKLDVDTGPTTVPVAPLITIVDASENTEPFK